MATIGYAQLPVPAGGDSPTVPAHLAHLADALDPHLVQHVQNLADRTARLANAPLQTLAIAADGTTWIKTSADTDTWITLYEPLETWRTLTLAAGHESASPTPQIRREGRQVHLRGRVQRTDGGLIGTTNSAVLANVPSDCIPKQLAAFAGGSSITGDPMTGVCRVEITSPSQAVGAGLVQMYSQDGSQGGGTIGTQWVDISGSYWLD
ncbi:hypothetical protein [Streptomyces sp. NPDC058045]|uniref:hypothetical protein n=1 Tax=Streptomyces sp. NPDC058045 TaxID=3346311 RepID=UPI0036F13FA1